MVQNLEPTVFVQGDNTSTTVEAAHQEVDTTHVAMETATAVLPELSATTIQDQDSTTALTVLLLEAAVDLRLLGRLVAVAIKISNPSI